jgi:hypothetical protein
VKAIFVEIKGVFSLVEAVTGGGRGWGDLVNGGWLFIVAKAIVAHGIELLVLCV